VGSTGGNSGGFALLALRPVRGLGSGYMGQAMRRAVTASLPKGFSLKKQFLQPVTKSKNQSCHFPAAR